MYNISSHYKNIFSFAKTQTEFPIVIYLHPFGSTSSDNLEWLGKEKKYGGPLILCYDQEPLIPGFNDELFEYVQKNILTYKINRIILVNTERNSEAKQYFLNKYNFVDVECFFHAFAAHDWYRDHRYMSIPPIKDRVINKKFISFNRLTSNARCYRSIFIAELAKHNLLSQGHISYSEVCPDNNLSYEENLKYALEQDVSYEYIKKTIQILNTIKHPLRIDFDNIIHNGSMHIEPITQNVESFLHIVTETCFWDKKQHLTEKIFKPILLKQPFVLLGCATNLEYLKSYGFKTFNKWWDESYDNINDPIKRLQAVVSIINDLCSKSEDELKTMLLDMEEVLEFNYNLFASKEFLDSIWSELTNNLESALHRSDVEIDPKYLDPSIFNNIN